MTAYMSQQAGDWTTPSDETDSPWYDDGAQSALASYPQNGDSATIAHDVHVDANVTVGTSPTSVTADFAVTINSGVTLTLDEDVTLTSRGSIDLIGNLDLSAGASVILDSTQEATDPAYCLGDYDGNYSANINCRGTSSKRCKIAGYDTDHRGDVELYALLGSGDGFNCTYTDFEHLGVSGSTRGCRVAVRRANSEITLDHCTFDDCYFGTDSQTNFTSSTVDSVAIALTSVVLENSVSGAWFNPTSSADEPDTAPTMTDCVFDCGVRLELPDVSITRCVFLSGTDAGTSDPGANASVEDSFFQRSTGGSSSKVYCDITDCFFAGNNNDNPHHLGISSEWRDVTVDGCIFDHFGTVTFSDEGDCILPKSSGGVNTVFVKRCMNLLRSTGTAHAPLVAMVGADKPNVQITHCTAATTGSESYGALINFCESDAQEADLLSVVKSNLCWAPSSGTLGYKAVRIGNYATKDVITASGCDYNVGWNLAAGSAGRGYNKGNNAADLWTDGSASDAGVDDNGVTLDGDPQFVDSDRCAAAWAASKGEAETLAAAVALISADTTLIPELVEWVKDGFKVQNADLENAGHDGVTIGAMAYESAPVNWGGVRGSSLVRT